MGAFLRGLGGPIPVEVTLMVTVAHQFDIVKAPTVNIGTSSSSTSSESSSGSSGSSRMEQYQVLRFYESARGVGAETGPQRSVPPWDW